jgi:uncharacterized protein
MSDAKSPPDLSMDEILATIRRIIAEDERTGTVNNATASNAGTVDAKPSAPKAAGSANDADDVLELTQAVNDDGSVRHLAPIGGNAARPLETAVPVAAVASDEPSAPPPPRNDPPSLRTEPGTPDAVSDRLVSDVASFATAAAFARLAAVPREPRLDREVPLGAGPRTLEEIVGELLRPLLKTWLDDNLPQIVERLVRAEIARVVDKVGHVEE